MAIEKKSVLKSLLSKERETQEFFKFQAERIDHLE